MGVSLEGGGLKIENEADDDFYHLRGLRAGDILSMKGVVVPAAERLKAELARMSCAPPPPPLPPPPPTPILQPPQVPPPPMVRPNG